MPYSKDELDNLPFYQELITGDESKYLEMISKRTETGTVDDGILRDNDGGRIVLFDKIVPGQGTDGTSFPANHTLSYTGGYFKYEENEETSKIIKREFTEL
jgi:hypothetical protein